MPPAPRAPSPGSARGSKKDGAASKRDSTAGGGEDAPSARDATAKAAKPKKIGAKKVAGSARRVATDRGATDENYDGQTEPERAPDRVRVFLKISAETGTSVSSCVTCDSKSKTAWALDFDGQRVGQPVSLDGVFSADTPEQNVYPEVVKGLVDEFIASPRGVGCLLVYGQAEAGKETLMYGEAGARVNMTPRTLPAPGHAPQQKAPGLVLAAFRAALAALPQVAEAGGPSEMHMGCVMLHMELLRDLLSPQSRVKISESSTEGVQLEGLHWQSITDVKEAEGLQQLATQNKAVHTMQADNGFLDACHIITAIKIATNAPAGSGIPQYKTLYLVELAAPPLPRPSGVPGLNVEDFCALNSSLRGLIASLGAMARKGNSRPPLRDSKLTRILSGALGQDGIRTHLLLCVSQVGFLERARRGWKGKGRAACATLVLSLGRRPVPPRLVPLALPRSAPVPSPVGSPHSPHPLPRSHAPSPPPPSLFGLCARPTAADPSAHRSASTRRRRRSCCPLARWPSRPSSTRTSTRPPRRARSARSSKRISPPSSCRTRRRTTRCVTR